MLWSRVDTEYYIHRVLHHPTIDCLPLPASLSALSGPCCTQFSTIPQLRVNQWIESQLPSHMPPDLLPPPDSLPPDSLPTDSLPPDWPPSDQSLPDQPPPSTPPILIDHGLQVYLLTRSITASKCISEFTRSRPPSASPNSLNHGLQVHLWVHSISRSPSAAPNTLDHGLQVHLQGATAGVRRYRGNEGGQSDGEYIFGRPRSRQTSSHSISSYHTMKIHTLSFPTFGLTRSVRDFVDPRIWVDPQRRVVSYLLTRFLRSSN